MRQILTTDFNFFVLKVIKTFLHMFHLKKTNKQTNKPFVCCSHITEMLMYLCVTERLLQCCVSALLCGNSTIFLSLFISLFTRFFLACVFFPQTKIISAQLLFTQNDFELNVQIALVQNILSANRINFTFFSFRTKENILQVMEKLTLEFPALQNDTPFNIISSG